jgi:hypothetical protein
MGTRGYLVSLLFQKEFGFWFIIFPSKHYSKILTNRWLFSIMDFELKREKNQKSLKETFMRAINSVFGWK